MHTLSHKSPASRSAFRVIIASIPRNRFLLAAYFLLTGWVCLAPAARAQTATFNTASVLNVGSPEGNPLNTPANIAVDGEGDTYIADAGNNRVVEMMANGTIDVLNVGTPGGKALNFPLGVAVDKSGDVYIADANNSRVVEFTAGGTANVLNVGAPGGTPLNFPQGIALDSAGDLYIADSNNSRVVEVTAGGTVSVVNAGNPGGLPLAFPCGVALDSAGDLYIADSNNNRVVEVTAGGTAAVLNVGTPGGTALNEPFGVAVSATGSIYIADSVNNRVVEMLPGGTSVVLNVGSPDGTSLNDLNGVTVDGTGDVYIPDTGNNRVVEVVPSSQALGQTTVRTSANPVTMSYTVSGYSGSSYTPNFKMTYGTDVQTGAATCSGGASPETCSVLVTLQPKLPGVRADGMQVLDPVSGAVLARTLVHGVGTSPLGVFEPGLQSTLNVGSPGGVPLNVPYGAAVDGAGNTYIADSQNNRVVEVSVSGVVSVLPVGTPGGLGLNTPDGIAVDGAGNIDIADYNNNRIVQVAPDGTASVLNVGSPDGTALAFPVGLAVDGAGDLYIADFGNGRIVEVTVDGASGVLNVGTPGGIALSGPAGVAVDDAGNVYIGDTDNNRVVKVTPGGAVSVLNVGSPGGAALNQPVGLATDGAGDVYIADYGNNRVVEVATDGTVSVLPVNNPGGIPLNGPVDVAVDGFGNVDIVDYGNNRVIGVNRTQQSLSFPTTNVGQSSPQQTVTLRNIGNQPLALTALAATTNFNLNGAATSCTDTTSLNSGDACNLGAEFEPVANGALTGTVNITDNNLNVTGAVQQVSLSGTGLGFAASIALTETPGTSVVYGTPVTVTATLTGANGVPTGNITYTVDGVLQPSASLSAGGIAQFTLPGTLAPGIHSIEVSYAGDADYEIATPSQGFTLTVTTAVLAGYTITANPNAVSISEGQTGNTTLTLTPTGGYTASVVLSCQNLPANAVCVFAQNPVQLSGNNHPVNVGLALQTSVQQARSEATPAPLSPILPALAFWWPGSLAGWAMLGQKRRRGKKQRRWMQLCLLVVVTGALAVGLSGCGGGFGPYVTPPGVTTVTVTATATSGTTVTTRTVHLTLTIAE
ncbi:MAG TPA: Ig-like domain repeat protein [Acidobacteriaceae bacterium]|jgi:DNA-binding beta-propeller fold protein YncE|nr:Ig-like domain repeat protein [Acidobacteriaceae bacterium]